MAPFHSHLSSTDGEARIGVIKTRRGEVKTPAFFPVVNLIGGTTVRSGGLWSRTRNRLFANNRFQGAMFQAMGFLDFNVSPSNLDRWRSKPMHEWYSQREERTNSVEPATDFTQPLFADSGGYKLMNARTFGKRPDEGGEENEWGIYTDPESILDLQLDYGADIIATLDYPIPPNLNDTERYTRMEASIESAKRTLELLEQRDVETNNSLQRPNVYISIHGHDYESIHWFVRRVLDEIGDDANFDGFAVGSLVPIRSNIDSLVDIVQGASNAIPEARRDELGLHVFGISGELFGLLSLIGVDSFDSSSYVQSAQYQKLIIPDEWTRKDVMEIDESWDCGCAACQEFDIGSMKETLSASGRDYNDPNGFLKSDYYALIAMHNFEIYQDEIERVREKIASDELLDYTLEQAQSDTKIKQGLKRAQRFDDDLAASIRNSNNPAAENAIRGQSRQTTPPSVETVPADTDGGNTSRSISLNYTPADFDALEVGVEPVGCPVLLILPCSQIKPYRDSRTHKAVAEALDGLANKYYKVSMSGLYGPVPEACETQEAVLGYEYVLSGVDKEQQKMVQDRLIRYLNTYGDRFQSIIGYATTKPYRGVIKDSFECIDAEATLLPSDLPVQQLAEYFREEHLEELRTAIEGV